MNNYKNTAWPEGIVFYKSTKHMGGVPSILMENKKPNASARPMGGSSNIVLGIQFMCNHCIFYPLF